MKYPARFIFAISMACTLNAASNWQVLPLNTNIKTLIQGDHSATAIFADGEVLQTQDGLSWTPAFGFTIFS